MKKSEARAKLVGYLMDYRKENGANISFHAGDLADFVLDCVERIGMKPPETSRNMTQKEIEMLNSNYKDKIPFTTEDVVNGYFWDKEDEEK